MLGVAWFCVWPTCKRKRDTLLVNAAYAEGIFVFVIAIRQFTQCALSTANLRVRSCALCSSFPVASLRPFV
jgi:hypothetical protein